MDVARGKRKFTLNVGRDVLVSSDSQEWYTPAQYVEAARAVMGGIDLDPFSCAFANQVVQAPKFYTREDDGFKHQWPGRLFVNPPYGYGDNGEGVNSRRCVQYLIEQYESGITTEAILLIRASNRFNWFTPLTNYPICFVTHPIEFYNQEDTGEQSPYDSAFVYFGRNEDAFEREFRQFGFFRWPEIDPNVVVESTSYAATTDQLVSNLETSLDEIDFSQDEAEIVESTVEVQILEPQPSEPTQPDDPLAKNARDAQASMVRGLHRMGRSTSREVEPVPSNAYRRGKHMTGIPVGKERLQVSYQDVINQYGKHVKVTEVDDDLAQQWVDILLPWLHRNDDE